jgi:hypothetical protein
LAAIARSRRREPERTMSNLHADATGDLAYKKIFPLAGQITGGSDRCRGEWALGRRGPGCCRRIRPA